jgi:GTPase SAR1 family protein
MQSKESTNEETAERFFKLIEAGDLAFHDIIMYAIVAFGITKVGKTTLCHHLNKNPLVGYKN